MKNRARKLLLATLVAASLCLSGAVALADDDGGDDHPGATVPDGGSTFAMLGCAMLALGYLRQPKRS